MNKAMRWMLPVLILVGAAAGYMSLASGGAPAAIVAPEPVLPLVRVVPVRHENVRVDVRTQGSVVPRTETELVPEVSGRVVYVSPALAAGGVFQAGETLLKIEAADYEIEVERARAAVKRAESELAHATAQLDRSRLLFDRGVTGAARRDDALNVEQIADAVLMGARAQLAQAQRALGKTHLRPPFAGRAREKRVDVGQYVTQGTSVASIYAVDVVEVRLPMPDSELAFLDLAGDPLGEIPAGAGPKVTIRARYAGTTRTWKGRIVRLEGELDRQSRMIHAVARVENSYESDGSERSALPVGLFVEATIEGKTFSGVTVLPDIAFQSEGEVLVVDGENRLRRRRVEVLREEPDRILVASGLAPGERVCVSPVDYLAIGTEIRIQSNDQGDIAKLSLRKSP